MTSDFVYFWAISERTRNTAAGLMTGTTGRQRLSWQDLSKISLDLPPIGEQRRICDLLESVDSYIAALQQQADAARVARAAVLSELLSAGGDDWTETSLGLLVNLRTGKLDVNAGVEGGEFPFFTCSRDTDKIDVAAYSGKSVIVAGNGDLNVKYYEGEFNAYQRTYILQAIDESVLNPAFLFHFMYKYVDTLRNDTQGSTIQYPKKAQFTEATIILPPLVEQKRIVDLMSSVDAVIQSADTAIADAKSLRSGLLSDLLSGDHEIPESYDRLLGAA
jgi:restriction endonuclease S subunit